MRIQFDFVSPKVPAVTRSNIQTIMGIWFVTNLDKYLGVPLMTGRCAKHHFHFIIEKIQSPLSSWKANHLFLAGRYTLIQSVLSGILSYIMQLTWLPQSTCDALNRLNWIFLCGSMADHRRMHLLNWNRVI